MMATIVVLTRGQARRWAFVLLAACALTSIASWTRNGDFQDIDVDGDSNTAAWRVKVHQRRPFHFHEFVHYYLGPKYFPEIGYTGLYNCLALADREVAATEGHPPRITGPVRDLADILVDKPAETAIDECRDPFRMRLSEAS